MICEPEGDCVNEGIGEGDNTANSRFMFTLMLRSTLSMPYHEKNGNYFPQWALHSIGIQGMRRNDCNMMSSHSGIRNWNIHMQMFGIIHKILLNYAFVLNFLLLFLFILIYLKGYVHPLYYIAFLVAPGNGEERKIIVEADRNTESKVNMF